MLCRFSTEYYCIYKYLEEIRQLATSSVLKQMCSHHKNEILKRKTQTLTNCLAYRYRYGPKFYNWLSVLLEKVQTTGANKNFIICCWHFSCCYLFVSLSDFSHISIYLSRDGLIFFCFSLQGALGLLLYLESKKHKMNGSLPTLMEN